MIEKIREMLFKIFKKESFIGKLTDKLFTKEIVTYIFFGVMTTAVNFITFYLVKKLFISIGWDGVFNAVFAAGSGSFQKIVEIFSDGSDYLDANLIAWVVGVIFAFVTNKLWVFESKSWKPSVAGKEFAGFMGARVFSFAVEMLFMFVMVTLLEWNEFVAKILVGIVVIIINYIFSKLIIFRKKKDEGNENI